MRKDGSDDLLDPRGRFRGNYEISSNVAGSAMLIRKCGVQHPAVERSGVLRLDDLARSVIGFVTCGVDSLEILPSSWE